MDSKKNGTVEQFDDCSRAISQFLRTIGEPADIKWVLHKIAIWSEDPTLWIEPWADEITSLRKDDSPVRFRPWKDHPEKRFSGRCANLCGAWLMGVCWGMIFQEKPPAHTPHFKNLTGDVEKHIAKHLPKLTKRFGFLVQNADSSKWHDLAEQMEIERVRLVQKHCVKKAKGERTATPTDAKIEVVRRLLVDNPRITRETLRKKLKAQGVEIGNTTITRIRTEIRLQSSR